MSYAPQNQSMRISRRALMGQGAAMFAVGGAITVGAILRASRVEAATKVTQVMAAYQISPKGEAKCGTCGHFQEPSSCELVDGQISSNGWCKFYAKKG
jgi:hypothetical protein